MADKNNTFDILDFGEPEKEHSIIKVIGVGGGGGNAVNHMYREGIHDVTFVLCNTDAQALNDSPVPVHLQLGAEGLGAGNKPERARQAAEESLEDIKAMLSDGTRMAFITAGMGGLEKVCDVRGVHYVNDSKATNVDACWYALESMKTKVVLIVGGKDKGNDYSPRS